MKTPESAALGTFSNFAGALDYGVACGFAFGYAGTSRSASAPDDNRGGSLGEDRFGQPQVP